MTDDDDDDEHFFNQISITVLALLAVRHQNENYRPKPHFQFPLEPHALHPVRTIYKTNQIGLTKFW